MIDDALVGEIRMFGGNYAPEGWLFCDGAALQSKLYPRLYSVIKNIYGGNATQFNLPDFGGRAAAGAYVIGNKGGNTNYTLTKVPPHTHTVNCSNDVTSDTKPQKNLPAKIGSRGIKYYGAPDAKPLKNFNRLSVSLEGDATPIDLMQPYLVLNFIICTDGAIPKAD